MTSPPIADSAVPLAVPARLDPRIWLLALGTFAVGTNAFAIAGILPGIARDLGIRLEAAGQLVSAFALAYAIGSPMLAVITARIPREKLIVWALIGSTIANASCALAPGYIVLMGACVAAGAMAAMFTPTAYVLAASAAPPMRRGAALSAVALGSTAAAVLGVPAGVMIGNAVGWPATFWLTAGLSLAAAVALSAGRLSPPRQSVPPGLMAQLAPLGRPRVLLALLPMLLWSVASFTVYTYIAVLLGAHGYGPSGIATLLSAYGLGGLFGSQIGGRLSDRFGTDKPIIVLLAASALNQLLLLWTPVSPVAAAISLFLWSLLGWACWVPQQTRLVVMEPQSSSVVLALTNSTVYAAYAIGAALGGFLLTRLPIVDMPLVGALGLAGALATFLAGRTFTSPTPLPLASAKE